MEPRKIIYAAIYYNVWHVSHSCFSTFIDIPAELLFFHFRLHAAYFIIILGFLYNGYDDGREWWETVIMLRKTALAVILIYFKDTFVQSFLALFVLTMAMYAQVQYKPYKHSPVMILQSTFSI